MSKTDWKSPPKAKVYEALSAVADDRVKIVGSAEAAVQSSDKAKTYTVVWDTEKKAFGSNDNASYWVGYIGYPIIATILKLGLVAYDPELARHLREINWNRLNQAYKRRYDEAVDYVLEQIADRGGPQPERMRLQADTIFAAIKKLKIGRIEPPGEPPKRG